MRGFIISFLLSFFSLFSTSFGLTFEVFLKKGSKFIVVNKSGGNLTVEETRLGEELPLFSYFDVKEINGKLLVVWKPSDPSVEKVLVLTDTGNYKFCSSERIILKPPKGTKLIRIFPLGKGGKIGFPAEVKMEG